MFVGFATYKDIICKHDPIWSHVAYHDIKSHSDSTPRYLTDRRCAWAGIGYPIFNKIIFFR